MIIAEQSRSMGLSTIYLSHGCVNIGTIKYMAARNESSASADMGRQYRNT